MRPELPVTTGSIIFVGVFLAGYLALYVVKLEGTRRSGELPQRGEVLSVATGARQGALVSGIARVRLRGGEIVNVRAPFDFDLSYRGCVLIQYERGTVTGARKLVIRETVPCREI